MNDNCIWSVLLFFYRCAIKTTHKHFLNFWVSHTLNQSLCALNALTQSARKSFIYSLIRFSNQFVCQLDTHFSYISLMIWLSIRHCQTTWVHLTRSVERFTSEYVPNDVKVEKSTAWFEIPFGLNLDNAIGYVRT